MPAEIDGATFRGPVYETGPQSFLFSMPGVVRCLVTGGEEIVYERAPGATDAEVGVFVFGSAFGALCHQRGLFPLHASTILLDGEAVAFVGRSGAGKSTLAATLVERGHRLLGDDMCVVWHDSARPEVATGPAALRLWQHALSGLGKDATGLDRVRAEMPKYYVPVEASDLPDRVPLRRVYALREARGRAPGIEHVLGLRAVNVLATNAYRHRFPRQMAATTQLFQLAALTAAAVDVALLVRPIGFEHLSEVYGMLEADWARPAVAKS